MINKEISRGVYSNKVILENTKEYTCWANMKSRCNNPNNPHYHNYGGRGITVCDRWSNFESFLKDMGKSIYGLSIERKDNNGGYEPSNCKWATWSEQQKNKRNLGHTDRYNKKKYIMKLENILNRLEMHKRKVVISPETNIIAVNMIKMSKCLNVTLQRVFQLKKYKEKTSRGYTVHNYFEYVKNN